MDTIFYTIYFSLFDSLTTAFQIIIFVLLLTTATPLRNALSFLAGLSGVYFVCGLAGYPVIDRLRVFLSALLSSYGSTTDLNYYASEILTGVAFAALGILYFFWKKKRGWSQSENKIILKLKNIKGLTAFGIGAFLSLTLFPASPPYLLTLGKYSALHLSFPVAAGLILLYNLSYVLPMVLILCLYLAARRGVGDDPDRLREKMKMVNVYLVTGALIGLGLSLMIDSGCYFVLGHALLRERFF